MSATDTAVTPYLDAGEVAGLDAYWRAANYLSVGQIYLLGNALLREPLALEHVKPRLLGHWGTTPGPEPALRAREPRDPAARARHALRHRPGPRRAGPRSRTRGSRARTPSATRGSRATAAGCSGCSGSSRSPAGSRCTEELPRPGGRFTRGLRGPACACTARSWTTRVYSPCAYSVHGEAETARRAGTRTSSSIQPATAPVLPVLHLNGYNNERSWRGSRTTLGTRCWKGYGHAPLFVEGGRPGGGSTGAASTDPHRRPPPIAQIQERAKAGATRRRAGR